MEVGICYQNEKTCIEILAYENEVSNERCLLRFSITTHFPYDSHDNKSNNYISQNH